MAQYFEKTHNLNVQVSNRLSAVYMLAIGIAAPAGGC